MKEFDRSNAEIPPDGTEKSAPALRAAAAVSLTLGLVKPEPVAAGESTATAAAPDVSVEEPANRVPVWQIAPSTTPPRVRAHQVPGAVFERVVVDGKFFRAGRVKFHPKGVTYGPFALNAQGEYFRSPETTRSYFQLIRTLGANLLRVYYLPSRWFLDLAL